MYNTARPHNFLITFYPGGLPYFFMWFILFFIHEVYPVFFSSGGLPCCQQLPPFHPPIQHAHPHLSKAQRVRKICMRNTFVLLYNLRFEENQKKVKRPKTQNPKSAEGNSGGIRLSWCCKTTYYNLTARGNKNKIHITQGSPLERSVLFKWIFATRGG